MRRSIMLAGLATTLLAAGGLALILTHDPADSEADQSVEPPDPVASPTSRSADARLGPATLLGPGSASTAVAPSSSGVPATPGRVDRGRDARAARAAFVAAKLQQAKASQSPVAGVKPPRESLPPEEVAAMEARGMDWRRLEKMMRDGVPDQPAAAAGAPQLQVDATDEAE